MKKYLIWLCISFGLTMPLSAQTIAGFVTPEISPSPYLDPPAAASYCEYASGVAASQAAPLLSPEVFAAVGNASAELLPSTLSPITTIANRNRVFGGGSYSLGNVQRGLALKQVARADCEQYKVTAGLEAFLQDNWDAFTSNALEAREEVLREGLEHTKEILSRTSRLLEAHVSTTQEYHGMQLRRDELMQILEQTDSDLGKAAKSESLAAFSLPELLKRQEDLLTRKEIEEGKAREAGAWDISVRGGVERVFNAPQESPYFATVTLSFNLGRLWQGSADRRASEGFRHWIQEDPTGASQRTSVLLQHFRAIQAAEAERLRENDILLDDLEQRLESVRKVGDERAQSYEDYVWFDYIKVKAEHAFLVAHLRDLAVVAGKVSP
ncbi:MAG TPA: hypothetical protein VK770_14450 [Candidatus Acidoferrum sp.]|jgi:hypothetical protein|nr:hypothetical protein [Candidatus Acidoferrum sp.]